MATINSYLNFSGNTEEAFNFYRSVFGGEFTSLVRFKDMPETDRIPAADRDKIMHVSLPVGSHTVLMATDAIESMGMRVTAGNNYYISINAESKAEADRLFSGLSAGGTVMVPMETASWGDYFGMFTDRFGVQWMVNHPQNGNG